MGHPDAGTDLASKNSKPRPLIYIYDFPEISAQYRNYTATGDYMDTNYGLDQVFPALLQESPYVTTDPEKADYFFVHIWLFWPGATPRLEPVLQLLSSKYPHWAKKNGADHIFVVTADQGRCEYRQYPQTRHAIFIQHFGGNIHHVTTHCNIKEMWGGDCDRELLLARALSRGEEPWRCHYPGQDIVVPTSAYERHDNAHDHDDFMWGKKVNFSAPPVPYIDPDMRAVTSNRSIQLFFSGHVDLDGGKSWEQAPPWADVGYSFGNRQTISRMFGRHPGYGIGGHTGASYWSNLARSVYCLAVPGWGWSGRYKVAINRGCVPVVLQDGIRVEFEEQLPLGDLSVRVPLWMSHKMPQLLDWLKHINRTAEMQANIDRCAWRLFWWRRPFGRAFEVVMCELKRRALGAPLMRLDVQRCELECGDGVKVPLLEGYNNV